MMLESGFTVKVRAVLLIVSLFCIGIAGVAEEENVNQALVPKLIEAIDDQTLYLDQQHRNRDGPVAQGHFYWRDLRKSFLNANSQEFSAYPYNKEVAEAWIVDSYLIVLGKSPGSVQIAVTASNQYGSMIDWFIVHVEEKPPAGDGSRAKTAFDYELSTTYASPEVDLYLRLPSLDDPNAVYGVVPKLPNGVVHDAERKFIYGRLTGGSSTHYWVGISTGESPQVQRFTLEPLTSNRSVAPNSVASVPISSIELLQPIRFSNVQRYASASQTVEQSTSPDGFSIAASIPSQFSASESFSNQLDFLYGITNSMHARQRNRALVGAEQIQGDQTHWSYASTGYANPVGQRVQRDGEASGIYVGIDSQVNQHFGSGLTIGFKGVVTSDFRESSLFESDQVSGETFASLMPYASWEDEDGSSVWGIFGVMRDPALVLNRQSNARSSDFPQDLVLGVMGWRQAIGSADNVQLSTIGDLGMVVPLRSSLFTDGIADMAETATRRMSAGLEMSFKQDTQLQPYVGVTRHSNTNPLTSITALEALGGVRYASFGGLIVEAEGRALAANSIFEDPDLLVSVAAHLDPGLQGEGFAFSVAPVYGLTNAPFMATTNLYVPFRAYQERSPRYRYTRDWMMSGSLSYGLPIGSGVVTPFGQIAVSTLNETRMGVRVALDSKLDRLFNLEVATVKSRFQQQAVDKGIDIQLRFVF